MVRASLILSALLATAGFATAGSTLYTSPDGVVRFELHDTACTGATREVLREEYVDQFHKAIITVGTTVVDACWFGPDGDGDYVIINEAGQGVAVPAKSLKRVDPPKKSQKKKPQSI